MPFLPSKISLAREFLKELLSKSPESHFEQSIELDRSEYEQHRRRWNEWVTIDVINKGLKIGGLEDWKIGGFNTKTQRHKGSQRLIKLEDWRI